MNTTVTELPFLAYNFASAVNCVPMPPLFVGPSNSHVIKTIFSFFRPLVSFQRRSFSFDACFAAEMSGKPVENFGDDSMILVLYPPQKQQVSSFSSTRTR